MMQNRFRYETDLRISLDDFLGGVAEAVRNAIVDTAWRYCTLLAGGLERGRQRRALSRLDDRLLRDIGVTPAQAKREAAKSFWHK